MRVKQGGGGTIVMMVFGMTRPGREHTTYRTRGGHADALDIFEIFKAK